MSRRTTPLQDAINHILARRDKNSMLEIKFINSVKGRGIFTLANFKQGDFVVEYRGELIDATEAEHRRNLYPSACSVFMFDFIWKQKTLCIDGALEDGSFGRLVNDEHRTPNCRMKLIEAEGKPHLCLFALKEIAAGSEITYDYGGKEWPWRKKLKIASIPSGQQCVAEPIAHDVEHHVISTDSFTDRELRAECQSSRPTADNSEHEVHSVGGQRGTSSLKELIGEVGVQYQELSPQAFSEELTSESKSKEVPQSSRAVPNDSACELKIASIPSGQQCVAEPIAHDVEHHVISTDSFTDRELKAECQSSRPTADNSEHEVHSVGGQRGTSSLKELIGEVGVQYQELSPQAFSEELTSESKSKEVPQSSRAVPNDSACECTIHRLVFESVKLDKCGICHSPLTAIRWHGLRCKQCRCVWHKICLQTSSEDWDMSDGDVSSDEEYIPNSASDSESSGTELSIELPGPSKNSHAASMPDLCVTFAEKEQTMDVKNNFEHILNDLETTDDLHPDQEPDSSESCQQKTKDACSEKSTVDMLCQNESPTKSTKLIKSTVNFCFVCGKPQTKFARHLETHENENAEVAQVLQLPKSSKDRKVHLERLRNLGNFKHNSAVKTTGSGCLKVKRISKKSSSSAETYEYCLYCKGMISRKEVSRHMKRCALRPENNAEEKLKDRVFGIASTQSTMSQPISSELYSVLGKMHKDDVSSAIRNDHYIMQLAQSLFNKHGSDRSKHEYIRQKVRELGRLLVTLRHTTRIHNMEEAIKPANFFILTNAVKRVSGFDTETSTFKAPSLALKLGHSLRKISDIIMCRALMEEDQEAIDSIRRFHTLHETKWSELVSHSALSNLSEAKYNKVDSLPLTRDVQKLQLYLGQQVESAREKLGDNPTVGTYAALAKVILCQVILFNRRREGEVARMTVKNFEDRDMSKLNDDISSGLTEVEKRLCQQFARVELKGKKGRKVAVILTSDMTDNLSLLVSKRKECGVSENNMYLFAIPCSDGHYRGQFGQFADACGAEHPQNLRSTNLRKQIATISQVMNLKDNELDQLADFLGHDIRVHREYYRLPQSTIQLAKISKLLMAMEKGSVKDIQGKTLDEIGDDIDGMATGSQQLPDASTLREKSINDNEEILTSVTSDLPHFSETAAQDDQGNDACVTSGSPPVPDSVTKGLCVSSRRCVKRPWSEEEIGAVMKHMKPFIENGITVTNQQCLKCKEKEQPILETRSIQNIRDFVRNRGLAFKKNK
ncbi:uncharacterized protein LOC113014492 isoform X4 [Astatotilapia calliptera]|uniref:uncharacterized protein LOC113014492 isoform X4 n=1 Tax=Astatotilapia calliptera TaxID=8154 RepID=UPI000E3FAE6E|nr:uncharacterized protein LOC113014492 isoform X4 [Astatotilapia calliptera]